jgi:hypothetical protein
MSTNKVGSSLPSIKVDAKGARSPQKIVEILDGDDQDNSQNLQFGPPGNPDSPNPKLNKSGEKSPLKKNKSKKQKEEEKKKEDKKKERPVWKVKLDKFLNWWPVTLWMTILTVYALLADDLRLIFFEKPKDETFYLITSISLFFFFLELFLASLATPDYWVGFYFWLDLVATLSLVTDIAWVWDPIVGTQDVKAGNAE